MKTNFTKIFFPHNHKEDHFKALDGLRGIAVLLVLLSHSSNTNWMFHEFLNFQKTGKIGVYLFFVLSAYLLDRQIAIAFITKKSSRAYWKNYLLRRFIRIYPLFIIAILAHGLLSVLGFPTVIDSMKVLVGHIILLKGHSIFWSIPVEFKYYFLSPIIMWICYKYLKWNLTLVSLLIVTLLIATLIIPTTEILHLNEISTLRYLPIFLVGTFISIYELLNARNKMVKIPLIIYDGLGVVCFVLILLSFPEVFHHSINMHSAKLYFPYAVAWGGVLIAAKFGRYGIKKILEWKLLRFFGTISYSAYLFHMIVLLPLNKATNIPDNYKVYIFFLATTLIAMLSYVLVEKPLSKIKFHKMGLIENSREQ